MVSVGKYIIPIDCLGLGFIYIYISHAVHCLTGSSMKTFMDPKNKNENSAWPVYFPAGLGVSRFLFDVLNDFDFFVDN